MSSKVLASPIQQAQWKQLQSKENNISNIAAISSVHSRLLDAQAIKGRLQELLNTYEITRTLYSTDDMGALWQDVAPTAEAYLEVLDWQSLSEEQITSEKKQIFAAIPSRSVSTPWHKVILAHTPNSSWLYLEISTMNTDLFSLRFFVQALAAAGSGKDSVELQDEIIQYSELAPWLAEFLVDEELSDARDFWTREKSQKALKQHSSLQRYLGGENKHYQSVTVKLGSDEHSLDNLATQYDCSVAEIVSAAVRQTINRFSDDLALSRVFDSRADEALALTPGPLSRALPLFTESASSWQDAIQQEVDMTTQGLDYGECFTKEHDHQDVGFSCILDAIATNVSDDFTIEQVFQVPEAFKIQFVLLEQGQNSMLQLTWDNSYMDEPAANYLLESVQKEILKQFGGATTGTDSKYLEKGAVQVSDLQHSVLEAVARHRNSPTAKVIEHSGKSATLAEIDGRANQLAHYLLNAGVQRGEAIGICLERSIDFVVSMLAIAKSGAAYVPVDIDLPVERIATMLEDAKVKRIISKAQALATNCEVVDLSSLNLHQFPDSVPELAISKGDLAYILFTSGSTGKAKGVSISHGALNNQMTWINKEFAFHENDVFMQRTSASFDASVWEFWSPLMTGATMVIAPTEINYEPEMFRQAIAQHQVTRLQIVPSLLDILLENIEGKLSHSLQTVFCGGEALKAAIARLANDVLGCDVVNLYGPSECCINSFFWRFDKSLSTDFAPIGYPMDNLTCRVLKSDGEFACYGESGELLIAGASVFEGYFGQPELTEQALYHCASDDTVYYKTGDIVRIFPDGNLMFIQRRDEQVKINGFRVEPEEVSMAVLNADLVDQAECVFNEYAHSLSLAYVSADASEDDIRAHLETVLPAYMIPQQFLQLEAFPLLPNGKLNKRALKEQAVAQSRAGYVAPNTELEKQIIAIWQEQLDTPMPIGIGHDFFAIGGHSLLAMKVLNRISEQFNVTVGVRDLFENKTVAELAAFVEPMMLLSDSEDAGESEEELENGLL